MLSFILFGALALLPCAAIEGARAIEKKRRAAREWRYIKARYL
nr:MAG TPA: hypothetical protein [Caudoviricetes sp.]